VLKPAQKNQFGFLSNKTDPYEWNNIADEEEYAGVRAKLKKEMLDIINSK